MKLYPSFKGDQLVLVGAGIFPWLSREHWILGDALEGRLLRLGKRKHVHFPKDKLTIKYDGKKLKIMGKTVVATPVIAHQLYKWVTDWQQA